MEKQELVKECALLRGLTEEDAKKVLSLAKKATFRKGDLLVKQGQPATQLFIITKGVVNVFTTHAGKKVRIVQLGEGQLIGEMALVEEGLHSADVEVAETPTEALVFNAQGILNLCESEPKIGYWLMRNIATDLAFKIKHNNFKMIL